VLCWWQLRHFVSWIEAAWGGGGAEEGSFLGRLNRLNRSGQETTTLFPFFIATFALYLLALRAPKFTVNSRKFLFPSPLTKTSAVFFPWCILSGLLTALIASVSWIFSRLSFGENGYGNQQM